MSPCFINEQGSSIVDPVHRLIREVIGALKNALLETSIRHDLGFSNKSREVSLEGLRHDRFDQLS